MKLIDRQDAIEVASKECFELRGVFGRIEDGLNALPTVKAIPIEWIEKQIEKGMEIDGWSVKACYEVVLKEWEKENEIN